MPDAAREPCAELAAAVEELAAAGPHGRDAVAAAARTLCEPGEDGVRLTGAEAAGLLPRVAAVAALCGVPMAAAARGVRGILAACGGSDGA